MTTIEQHVDSNGTMNLYDPAAMRVREAMLALLRAWEEMYALPRSIPTRAERAGEMKQDKGHHNR